MNIVGVVVRLSPGAYEAGVQRLEDSTLCELYFQDAALSKAVVVLEGADDSAVLSKMRQIEALKGVLGADLIHLSSEDEAQPPADGAVPASLDDAVDARSVRYGGSVYSWMNKT
jgi:nitrate reductase NapAB chaperone NapD